MRKKTLLKVCALLAAVSLTAGCWDSRDINDRDILTAVVVDKIDKGYMFYVEVPPVEQSGVSLSGGDGQQKPMIEKAEGRTLTEARQNLDRKMDRPIYLGTVQTVILTDEMARFGIEEYMQRLREISDYRKTVDVVVTTEDPQKLLETTSEHSSSPGTAIYDTIESLIDQGELYKVPLMEILERLSSSYKHYVLPTFALADGDLMFTGMTVFSGGMKTGFILAAETNSIVFIQAKKPKIVYTVPFKDEYAAVEVTLSGHKIKPHYENGKISFDMDLNFMGVMMYPEKDKLVSGSDEEIIRAMLKAMLDKEFAETFLRSQTEYKVDCYTLFENFQNVYPEEYKKMNWAQEYEKAAMNLSVDVTLRPTDLADYNP